LQQKNPAKMQNFAGARQIAVVALAGMRDRFFLGRLEVFDNPAGSF